MLTHRFVTWMLLGFIVLGANVTYGQDYPTRPIRIVTVPPGGTAYLLVRLLVPGLTNGLGQQIIVDSRPAGAVLAEAASQAPADGYSLLVYTSSLWIGPLLQPANYDAVNDFVPISWLGSSPNVLVVNASSPVKSLKDLIILAKSSPGKLNYASFSIGGGASIATELFKSMAGLNMVAINYKGVAPAITDLSSGRIDLMFDPPAPLLPLIKTGRLRALGVTSAQPSALVPGVPTIASADLPGYESILAFGLFAPAKTSSAIVNRLNQEVVRVLNQSDVKAKLLETGIEAVGSSPEQFADFIKTDLANTGKVIKSSAQHN